MKEAVEFTDFINFKLVPIDGPVEGLSERVIFKSPDGDLARILEFAPETDTSLNGVQVHNYREELFIIEGSVTDLTLGETFTKGMVASRPPGMKHGPWKTKNGCIMYEVRYFEKKNSPGPPDFSAGPGLFFCLGEKADFIKNISDFPQER